MDIIFDDENIPRITTLFSMNHDIYVNEKVHLLVFRAIEIANLFNNQDQIPVTIKDLMLYEKSINQFYFTVVTKDNLLKMVFSVDDNNFKYSAKIGCIFTVSAKIGKYTFGCMLGLIDKPFDINEDKFKIISTKRGYHRYVIIEGNNSIPKERIQSLSEATSNEMESDGITPVIFL